MFLKLQAQRGSALVIAVFIIVVMLLLVFSVSRLIRSSSETVVYEVQGSRTLFAAQSGLELALTELFPLNSGTANCAAISPAFSFSGAALDSCNAVVTCSSYLAAEAGSVRIFRLNSTANCSAADVQTSRTIQIEVR
ncbi:type II secretory pathway component [Rheinheimera baltica]|uniref:Type II secretory pathway component n=1 Tax=Rheinheimera baltica TaxID=67576 RepID=A0ABT9HXB4_9GAMM|nr:type II secretory pathway component [Rheinheimera baltica]MDP5135331.1 type II secretory pathway component [Rheinheimera baltica]